MARSGFRLRPAPAREIAALGGPRTFRGKRVIDIGAGEGRYTLALARIAERILAIDPQRDALALARRRARELDLDNVRFQVGVADELRVRGYDVALFSWSLC